MILEKTSFDAALRRRLLIYAGIAVLIMLAFALVALTSYVEGKLEQSGERQAALLTEQAARFAGEHAKDEDPYGCSTNAIAALCLFDTSDGRVVSCADGSFAPVAPGMSVYDLVRTAIASQTGSTGSVGAAERLAARTDVEASRVQEAVAEGGSYVVTGVLGGRKTYVAFAPTDDRSLYACSVIPIGNVRAEVDVVSAIFAVVFTLSVICVVLAISVAAYLYRKQAREREMEMRTHLYAALSDSLDLSVILYSPEDGTLTSIVAEKGVLGADLDELLADPSLFDELSFSEGGRSFVERVRDGKIRTLERGELSFEDAAGGSVRYADYTARPLIYEGKEQILVTARDATSDKLIELSMRDAMEAAEAANRAKSDFLSHMSHDIRTPMNVIMGMLALARRNVDQPARLKENLDNIERASAHLLDLINEVLDLSKIESGKVSFENVPFKLDEVVAAINGLVEPLCRAKAQTYSCKLSGPCDTVFVGDPMRLRQILVNLLTNAVKYTDEGGRIMLSASVRPALSAGYRRITCVVSDNGIGMSADYLEHLFEPFVMEGRSRSQGTGLGMAIVRNVVNAMGGDIHVDTAEGRGTTVTVVLNNRFETTAGASTCTRSAQAGPVRMGLRGARVLLAEDNELNAEIVCELLAPEGVEVDWVENGRAALDRLASSSPGFYDAVLMDVQMPEMNGYEATRAIRALARPDVARIPVIAMSANAFADDVLASLKSGMNAHLSKPIDIDEVLAALAREIGGCDADASACVDDS